MADGAHNTRAEENQAVPAIVIGLGGTGKEVLLRIRQRFVQEYGVAALPVMRYLWIDCDPNSEIDITGKSFDWLLPDARLSRGEIVPATVSQQTIDSYRDNQSMHPWLFNWIPPGVFAKGAILEGASQIRPRGRLGFYENYPRIRDSIIQAKSTIEGAEAIRDLADRYSMHPTTTKRAYIVCSLAGGTGGGMFLDAAFLCQKLLPSYEVIGMLVLPTLFGTPEQALPLYANAYASLMELEHYGMPKDVAAEAAGTITEELKRFSGSSKIARVSDAGLALGHSRHDFAQYWDRASSPSYERGPAFDYCYLLDARSEAGALLQPHRKTDLLDMAAESLYWEFAGGSFASQKRSMRDNLRPQLGTFKTITYPGSDGTCQYEVVFSNLYSSMGFSKVQVPVEQIRSACGYRLAMDLVDRWTAAGAPAADLKAVVRSAIGPKDRPIRVAGQDYMQALDRDDKSVTFAASNLSRWTTKLRGQIADGGGRGDLGTTIDEAIERMETDSFKDDPSAPPEQRGSVVRMLDANGTKHEEDVARQLRSYVARLLEERGVPATIEYLKQLKEVLEDEESVIARRAGEAREAAEDARKAFDGYCRVLASEQAGKHWRSVKQCALAAVEQATEYLRRKAEAMVLDRAGAIHARVIDRVMLVGVSDDGEEAVEGGWVQRLSAFQGALSAMKDGFAQGLERYDREEDHLIFAVLYRNGMYEDYLKSQDLDLGTEVLSLYSALDIEAAQLLGIFEMAESKGRRTTQDAIETHTRARFKHMNVSIDAIQTLYEWGEKGLMSTEQRSNLVDRFVQGAAPWLPPSGYAEAHRFESKSEFVRGERQGQQSDAYRWFDETVDPLLQDAPFAGMNSRTRTDAQQQTVLLCSERAAFPLAWIDGIETYRRCYTDLFLTGRSHQDYFPHIDQSRIGEYADICALSTSEVAELRRAHKALLLGMILGAMRVRGEVVMFLHHTDFGESEIALGKGRSGALVALTHNPNQLTQVEADVNERLLGLSMESRQRFIGALRRLLDTSLMKNEAVDPLGKIYEMWNLDRTIVEEASVTQMGQLIEAMGDDEAARSRIDAITSELAAGSGDGPWYSLVDFDGVKLYQLKA